jgi:copper(I)-binding protein
MYVGLSRVVLAAVVGFAASFGHAMGAGSGSDVEISNAWVRATVPGQPVAGAYLDAKATRDLKLVGVSSPAAKRGELHEMKHEGGVMKMRQVKEIDLPSGKTVSLAPGGLHIMLFDPVKPLVEGERVSMTLQFRRPSGEAFSHTIEAPVRGMDAGAGHSHGAHHDHGK